MPAKLDVTIAMGICFQRGKLPTAERPLRVLCAFLLKVSLIIRIIIR